MTKMTKAKLNGEFEIIIPDHRAARPDWYTEEGWERPRLKALHEEIKLQNNSHTKKPVVYYVGAEEGEMPALCQMWGAHVAMFEPNPKVWPNIKAIWEANQLDDPLMAFWGFASNETRMVDGYDIHAGGWPECADNEVIGNHGFKELYLEAENYNQIKLDDVYDQGLVPSPTIITFDCEGSDWEVMKGAETLLKQYRPVIFASIHPEFMFHQFNQYSRDFRNWLIGFGYNEEVIDYKHELHTIYRPVGSP